MADLTLRELARRAKASGMRDEYLPYFRNLIRVGGNPLEIYKRLAEMFGHPEDIDMYLAQVAQSEDTINEFLAPLRKQLQSRIALQQMDEDEEGEEPFELTLYFDYDLAQQTMQQELERARKRPARSWGAQRSDRYNYNIERVLRVYVAYFDEEIYDLHHANQFQPEPIVENWQRGIIADVILDDGTNTTLWVEEWYAMPDAPDAVAYGTTIHRFDDPKWLWGHAQSLVGNLERNGPQFARAALLPRLRAILDAGPYLD